MAALSDGAIVGSAIVKLVAGMAGRPCRCAGFHRGDEAGGQPEVSGGSMRRPADRFHAVGIMGAQTRNTSTEGQAAGLTGGCMA